jgi:hypothetical protein
MASMIRHSNGEIFTVKFIKRTTGEERTLNARTGVKKGITGNGMSFSPKDNGLVVVYEMNKKQYRMIPLENLKELHICGNHFQAE